MAGRLAQTVTRKLAEMNKQVGGFGNLLLFGFDYADNPAPWLKSMRLLAEEVMPHFQDQRAAPPPAAKVPIGKVTIQ